VFILKTRAFRSIQEQGTNDRSLGMTLSGNYLQKQRKGQGGLFSPGGRLPKPEVNVPFGSSGSNEANQSKIIGPARSTPLK
jgi:hypothetical protein